MHKLIGDVSAYALFNSISIYATILLCFFFIGSKTKYLGLFSKRTVFNISKRGPKAKKYSKYFLAFAEMLILAAVAIASTVFNPPFGELVGTGYNYFGCLFAFPVLVTVASVVMMANPMEQADIATPLLPFGLIFARIACYCEGCCWGIPWEYGPYNYNEYHPGNQVPVQAIEAGFVLLIFIFLLFYRKKAKKGTMFPMYLITYCGLRFFNEFFTDNYPNVLGPFNMYQLLCVAGFIAGLVLFFAAVKLGDRMFKFIDNKHEKFDMQILAFEKHIQRKNKQAKNKK